MLLLPGNTARSIQSRVGRERTMSQICWDNAPRHENGSPYSDTYPLLISCQRNGNFDAKASRAFVAVIAHNAGSSGKA